MSSFIPTTDVATTGVGSTSGDYAAFDVKSKYDAIAENEDLIPHTHVHANKNEKSMRTELVVNLFSLEQGDFITGNYTVESNVLVNYFAASDYVHHSWCCIESLDEKGANFTLEEVGELITIDYCRDI